MKNILVITARCLHSFLSLDLFDQQPMMVMEGDPNQNLDHELGTEVVPSASNQSLARRKRSASDGASIEDYMFSLTEVASQTIAADQAEFGDSWTFELVIDLPILDIGDMTDIKIELFGLDPDYGLERRALIRQAGTSEPI